MTSGAVTSGAVTGGAVKYETRKMALEIRRLAPGTPVVGPSVWDYSDMEELNYLFPAMSFGSIWLRYPWRPTAFVRRYESEIALKMASQSPTSEKMIDP